MLFCRNQRFFFHCQFFDLPIGITGKIYPLSKS
jgi:hypothetical protein